MVTFEKLEKQEFVKLDPDVRLMMRVVEDDKNAFEELYRRNVASVEKLISHVMGHRKSTEDLAQEVFLRVFRARKNYQPTAQFKTWLYTITRNVALKERQRLSRSVEFNLDRESDTNKDSLLEELSQSCNHSPTRRIEHEEMKHSVHRAITRLNDRQQSVISMYYLEEQSYSNIASRMKTSPHAIKSLLHRARTNLCDSLSLREYEESLTISN